MALPSTGNISMSQVNTELKKSATAVISLNDSNVRKLAKKPSGTISMNDLRGKSSYVHKTIEILNVNYRDFGVDISKYYPLTFPNQNFVNGVVRIKELKNLGEQSFDICELDDKNNNTIFDFTYSNNNYTQFIYKITNSNNNPLAGAKLIVEQSGNYYEPSWDPDMSGSYVDCYVGIKVIITLEADFE